MQNICKEKLNWDDMLSQKLLKDWHDCLTKLEKIGSIKTHGRFEIGNNTNPVVTREFQFLRCQFERLWGLYLC